MKAITSSELKIVIKEIGSSAKHFDNKVQQALLGCVYHILEHGNTAPVVHLLQAMGRSTRKGKAVKYLVDFLTVDGKSMVTVNKSKDTYVVKYSFDATVKDAIVSDYDNKARIKWFDVDKAKDKAAEKSEFDKLNVKLDAIKFDVSRLSSDEKRILKGKLAELMGKL